MATQIHYVKFMITTVVVLIVSIMVVGVSFSQSLNGRCTNWMTTSLSNESSGNPDQEATRAACRALETSGNFVTRYVERTNTCLICSQENWTPAGAIDPSANWVLGSWSYSTDRGFKDTHQFLDNGITNPNGTWSLSGGTLTVKWPNGWENIYEAASPSNRLTGFSISPNGNQRVRSTLERSGTQSGTSSWIFGSWRYETDRGFTDTHHFLSGGRMRPNGTWSLSGNQLIVSWPNGWKNIYNVSNSANRLIGVSLSPEGESIPSTLEKH